MVRCLRKTVLLIILFSTQPAAGQTLPADQSPTQTQSSGTETRSLDLGQLDGVNYVNDFFGVSLSVPREWVVVSAQRRAEVAKESRQMVRTPTQTQQEQVEASIDRSTNLLSLTKLPAGQPGNASFMLIAERIPSPTIKDGPDVLRAMERAMKGSNFTVEFQGGIRTEQFSGTDFGVATIKNTSPYGVFMQKVYVTVKNGYALEFFLTYLNDDDLIPFEGTLKSLKLK